MTATVTDTLPTSVRGQPMELRRLIRKKQNSESAKRCRLRRKQEAQRDAGKSMSTAQQMAKLEALISHLATNLVHTQNAVAALIASGASGTAGATISSPPQSPRFSAPTQSQFFNTFQQELHQPHSPVSPTEPTLALPLQLPQPSTTVTTTATSNVIPTSTPTRTPDSVTAPTPTLQIPIPIPSPPQATAATVAPTSEQTPQSTAANMSTQPVAAVTAYENMFDEGTSAPQEVGSPFSDLDNFQLQVTPVGTYHHHHHLQL